MATEIERKFLVQGDGWRQGSLGVPYRQGYLLADGNRTIRVRVAGDRGYLTIKGPMLGISRSEYEYPIALADAEEMLASLCQGFLVEKQRYRVEHAGHLWEVDEFQGQNQGLIVAEIELSDPEEVFALPDWVGAEVSHDRRYGNAYLSFTPYCTWDSSPN
ncbi:CYTH domain-containing protein [Synechococcus elongatus]|uniref:Adenylate cyclase n=2 Tax=Synechococcus elongatus TaxID=32046 RepID=Q31JZ2_SYNE7|nr:CYTH domain-containing protein [Synechococcus elongatus]ABB58627.1 adenylate cyclase [Synechococcus elongatus PCC 7942 = FACHB-805]AJD56920.1 adenylate cyclase [Synechococcus elongatus UTEX 2973]MBD2587848.1 CYTH domain-containing protein [Synechococcus elongatus FACHB-242]MBD2688916.1 CYTH domain-containing protein [Synechococcus elongatus FACHB-1061]MBD2707444.1 CYTH domain-containing protein [Synechococcus elongatus PCC 7942 = FACHB-805]